MADRENWWRFMEPNLIPYHSLQNLGIRSMLVLAPHPDDEVFGCGGTLALALAAGIRVTVIVVSDGGMGGDADIRKQESIAAATAIGYADRLTFWRLPDRGIIPSSDLVLQIRQACKDYQADWLLAPSPFEVHPDHRSVCMAAMEATLNQQAIGLGFYEVGYPLMPSVLVDITKTMPVKREAMRCFASQQESQDYAGQIESLNRYRAYTLGPRITHAEALWFVNSDHPISGLPDIMSLVSEDLRRRFEPAGVSEPTLRKAFSISSVLSIFKRRA